MWSSTIILGATLSVVWVNMTTKRPARLTFTVKCGTCPRYVMSTRYERTMALRCNWIITWPQGSFELVTTVVGFRWRRRHWQCWVRSTYAYRPSRVKSSTKLWEPAACTPGNVISFHLHAGICRSQAPTAHVCCAMHARIFVQIKMVWTACTRFVTVTVILT